MKKTRKQQEPSVLWTPRFLGAVYTVITISLIFYGYRWAEYRGYLNVASIVVSGARLLNDDVYIAYVADLDSLKMTELPITEISENISRHPFVKATRVSRAFPGKVAIEIQERSPLAWLNQKTDFYIDEEGIILPSVPAVQALVLPILSNFNPARELYPVGEQTLSQPVLIATRVLAWLLKQYPTLYDRVSEIRLNPSDDYEIILTDYPTRIVLGQDQMLRKLAILQYFETKITGKRKLTDYTYIDLRYQNQVIAKERRR
ncbi:MAG: cell division protein FtsQ/DivIB [Fidelibacterota bacterium]